MNKWKFKVANSHMVDTDKIQSTLTLENPLAILVTDQSDSVTALVVISKALIKKIVKATPRKLYEDLSTQWVDTTSMGGDKFRKLLEDGYLPVLKSDLCGIKEVFKEAKYADYESGGVVEITCSLPSL